MNHDAPGTLRVELPHTNPITALAFPFMNIRHASIIAASKISLTTIQWPAILEIPPQRFPRRNHRLPPILRRKPKPKHDFPQTQVGKLWDAFGNPEEPVNTMPGGTYNSAGGKPKEVHWTDAFKFNSKEIMNLHRLPCSRDSLLVGLGAGFGVGGVRAILGGKITPRF